MPKTPVMSYGNKTLAYLIIQLSLIVSLIVIFAWCKYSHFNLLFSGLVLIVARRNEWTFEKFLSIIFGDKSKVQNIWKGRPRSVILNYFCQPFPFYFSQSQFDLYLGKFLKIFYVFANLILKFFDVSEEMIINRHPISLK